MPIICGKQYIDRIDNMKTDIRIDGEKLKGKLSEHPAFSGVMKSQAKLYDLQHDTKLKEIMTFVSETTGNRIGTSFMQPKSKEDLEKRRLMIQEWAKMNAGMMGRSPDYMNTVLMAVASAAESLAEQGGQYAENLRNFYEYARENDLSFTHTFVNPQVNRVSYYMEAIEKPIAARIVDKTSDGLVIKGARLLATQGGITDEILVSPSGVRGYDTHLAYAFSIPSDTKGLKFICRESFIYDQSTFNHPLASRFEEMDSIVVFDNVVVPWERVFVSENVSAANRMYTESSYYALALHQVISRQIVKTGFFLGVAQLLVNTINIGEYPHVQEKINEMIIALENHKALLLASEMNAKLDKWGIMAPHLNPLCAAIIQFPKIYPRFSEILQLLGASGLVSLPTEKDFQSDINEDLQQYLQGANCKATDRVKLFRLAWDASMSAFGSRQTLYERFFFGDPVRLNQTLYQGYDRSDTIEYVERFLKE